MAKVSLWWNKVSYKEDKLQLYPNPAGDYVVIEYTLANESGDSRIVFVDSKGMQVKTVKLENKHITWLYR